VVTRWITEDARRTAKVQLLVCHDRTISLHQRTTDSCEPKTWSKSDTCSTGGCPGTYTSLNPASATRLHRWMHTVSQNNANGSWFIGHTNSIKCDAKFWKNCEKNDTRRAATLQPWRRRQRINQPWGHGGTDSTEMMMVAASLAESRRSDLTWSLLSVSVIVLQYSSSLNANMTDWILHSSSFRRMTSDEV